MQQPIIRVHSSNSGRLNTSVSLGGQSSGALTFSRDVAPQSALIHKRTQANKPTSTPPHHSESHGDLQNSYFVDKGDAAACEQAGNLHSSTSPSPSPPRFPTISNSVLADVQRDFPTVYAALHAYEKAVRHHKEKFKAKETELLRCIGVGEELLAQIDALKQRCEALAQERDDAVAAAELITATAENNQDKEFSTSAVMTEAVQAAASRATAAATRAWEEEKRTLAEKYEAQCVRFREKLQDALQQAAMANAQKRELETALQRTREHLYHAEEQLRSMEEAYEQRESAYAAQRSRDVQQQQHLLQQHIAQLQQQADVDKETVLAEATVELERLQRALVRTEKELKEEQRLSQRSATLLSKTPSNASALEIADLRRQLRQLEDVNHDLQMQLRKERIRRRSSVGGSIDEGRLAEVSSNTATNSNVMLNNRSNKNIFPASSTMDHSVQSSLVGDAVAAGGEDMSASASLQRRLWAENARLRQKLQDVASQAQDEVDKAHAARLEQQQQLKSVEAQMQQLRNSVILGLEQELQQTREQLEVAETRGNDLQGAADEFEVRVMALQKEQAETASQLDTERRASAQLQRDLREAQARIQEVQQKVETASAESQHKDTIIVQFQREKQQLVAALRTLQAQTSAVENALSEMHAKQEEGTARSEMNTARLQERCVLLEQELEDVKEERVTLCGRLRDAEEAIDVLKDAQRIAQESVREAQRSSREAEEKARAEVEQHQHQQQVWRARAMGAEQNANQLHSEVRELTQRHRELEEEVLRRGESLQQSVDKTAALTAELRQLREVQSNLEESSRKRWQQQYAQNTANRDQLLVNKERQIEALQSQQQELRQALRTRDERLDQLQQQRRQAQAALSEAVASTAAYKGRVQALEEELARMGKERADTKAELRRLSEKYERAETTGITTAGQDTTAITLRISELEKNLAEYEAELRHAERQRQLSQKTLLQLILPSSAPLTDATPLSHLDNRSSGSGCDWDDVTESLDDAVKKLAAQNNTSQVNEKLPKEGGDEGNSKAGSSSSVLPDTCQRAVTAMLRALRDWIERLHSDDEQRWAALRNAVLTTFAAHKNTEGEDGVSSDVRDRPTLPPSPKRLGGLNSTEELRDRLVAAKKLLLTSFKDLQMEWVSTSVELAKVLKLIKEKQDQTFQLGELKAQLTAKESECVATQTALEDARKKYTDALHKTTSLQSSVDQLQQDLVEREGRLVELEHRLEMRTTEIQAERTEWMAKWHEGQRHREKEKAEKESELIELRARLATAEEAAATSVGKFRLQAEEAEQQIRAQLQTLQKSAAATEAALRQQVSTLTQEKARVTCDLRRVKKMVVELEERVNAAEGVLKTKDAQLVTTEKALHETRKAHHQILANGVAAEAFEQESMANQIASLQLQLRTCRNDCELMEKTHAAEKAELFALRKVNAALESRLAEVEEERAPLRQQLHHLLSFSER